PRFFVAGDLAGWSASVNGNAVGVLRSGPPGGEEDLIAARGPNKIDDAVACRQGAPYVAPKLIQPEIRLPILGHHRCEVCTVGRKRRGLVVPPHCRNGSCGT